MICLIVMFTLTATDEAHPDHQAAGAHIRTVIGDRATVGSEV